MLRTKEQQDLAELQKRQYELEHRYEHRNNLKGQMVEKEQLKLEAMQEYEREKGQVEHVINQMVQEDMAMMNLTKMKQDQAKVDMKQSVLERREKISTEKQIEEEENTQMKMYAE